MSKERPGCFGRIHQGIQSLLPTKRREMKPLPYRMTDKFLSPAEFSYYRVLQSILGPKAAICPKVRLLDLLSVVDQRKNYAYFGKISQKHIDFLVCEAETMKPVMAIELDDASHKRADRKERDKFLDTAFQAAGFPLLHVPVRAQYNRQQVIDQLKSVFLKPGPEHHEQKDSAGQPATRAESEGSSTVPNCLKCGIPMVLRVATKGEHKGRQFYGCVNYPQCKTVLPVP